MNKIIGSCAQICKKAGSITSVFFVSFLLLIVELFFDFLYYVIGIQHKSNFPFSFPEDKFEKFGYLLFKFLEACLLAPVVETAFFQLLLYQLLIRKLGSNPIIFLVSSAFIFGVSHFPQFTAILVTTTLGLLISFFYYIFRLIYSASKAYWMIVFIHTIVNLVIFIHQL